MASRKLRGWYIARVDLSQPHLAGVARKIGAQVKALEAALGPVTLFTPEGTEVARDGTAVTRFGGGARGRRLLHFWRFYKTVGAMREPVDYAYIRYQRTSPSFLWMLRTLRRRNPFMVILTEIPTWPYRNEEASLRERIYGLTDRFLSRFLRRYVDRIVTFSQATEIMGIPTICTDNGTDVFAVEPLSPPPEDSALHLLGLANLSFWHGYDRVLAGMKAYADQGGDRRVIFELVGSGNELPRLRADTARFGLEDVVRFHGPLSGEALTGVMARCHVAISSIGIHRVQNDTSTLKSREYCARGLPFVLGHADRDFTHTPFAFRVPADESPLDIAALVALFDDLKTRSPGYARDMRDFAERELTWESKLRPVVEAIQTLVPDRAQGSEPAGLPDLTPRKP